jgi:hypothetical protein
VLVSESSFTLSGLKKYLTKCYLTADAFFRALEPSEALPKEYFNSGENLLFDI